MDTKELVERLQTAYRRLGGVPALARAPGGADKIVSIAAGEISDAIERLERELAENIAARNDFAKDWDAAHNRAEAVESELATLRAENERLERERDELLNDICIGCSNIERAEAEATTLRARVAKMEALRTAGAGLANCAYNLEQNSALPARDRIALRNSYEAWDAAIRSIAEEPAS